MDRAWVLWRKASPKVRSPPASGQLVENAGGLTCIPDGTATELREHAGVECSDLICLSTSGSGTILASADLLTKLNDGGDGWGGRAVG